MILPAQFVVRERKALGPRLPIATLLDKSNFLLKELGEPHYSTFSPGLLEEALHELAHHATLSGPRFGFAKRPKGISVEIEGMSPMCSDANELETLAVEFNTAWWLQVRLNTAQLVRYAANNNMSYFSERAAKVAIGRLRHDAWCYSISRSLAILVRGAKVL